MSGTIKLTLGAGLRIRRVRSRDAGRGAGVSLHFQIFEDPRNTNLPARRQAKLDQAARDSRDGNNQLSVRRVLKEKRSAMVKRDSAKAHRSGQPSKPGVSRKRKGGSR